MINLTGVTEITIIQLVFNLNQRFVTWGAVADRGSTEGGYLNKGEMGVKERGWFGEERRN